MTFPDDMELAVALYMAETASPRPQAIERLLRERLGRTSYLTAKAESLISLVPEVQNAHSR